MCLYVEIKNLCENLSTTQTLLVFSSSLWKNGHADARWAYLMSKLEWRGREQIIYFGLIFIKIVTYSLAFTKEPDPKLRQLIESVSERQRSSSTIKYSKYCNFTGWELKKLFWVLLSMQVWERMNTPNPEDRWYTNIVFSQRIPQRRLAQCHRINLILNEDKRHLLQFL